MSEKDTIHIEGIISAIAESQGRGGRIKYTIISSNPPLSISIETEEKMQLYSIIRLSYSPSSKEASSKSLEKIGSPEKGKAEFNSAIKSLIGHLSIEKNL